LEKRDHPLRFSKRTSNQLCAQKLQKNLARFSGVFERAEISNFKQIDSDRMAFDGLSTASTFLFL
jgi:hypothetical protein